jgi:MtN3 and saliva related transmembrane protein
MEFNLPTIIGIVASILTSLSLLPQLLKIIKEKKSGDISLLMLGVLFAGLGLWIYYGVLKEDWILITANSLSFSLSVITAALTLKYKS